MLDRKPNYILFHNALKEELNRRGQRPLRTEKASVGLDMFSGFDYIRLLWRLYFDHEHLLSARKPRTR